MPDLPSVTIRPMSPEDIESVVELEAAQLDEHGIPYVLANLREVLRELANSSDAGFLLVAEAEAAVVGIAYAACLLSLEHGARSGILEELYVRPAWRNRGIGGQLLAAAIERARALDWPALELEVVAGHERAAALYLRAGFTRLDRTRYSFALLSRSSS